MKSLDKSKREGGRWGISTCLRGLAWSQASLISGVMEKPSFGCEPAPTQPLIAFQNDSPCVVVRGLAVVVRWLFGGWRWFCGGWSWLFNRCWMVGGSCLVDGGAGPVDGGGCSMDGMANATPHRHLQQTAYQNVDFSLQRLILVVQLLHDRVCARRSNGPVTASSPDPSLCSVTPAVLFLR